MGVLCNYSLKNTIGSSIDGLKKIYWLNFLYPLYKLEHSILSILLNTWSEEFFSL